jgi:hypothetical protein
MASESGLEPVVSSPYHHGEILRTKLSPFTEFAIAFAVVMIARGSAVTAVNLICDDFYFRAFDNQANGLAAAHIAQLRAPAALVVKLVYLLGAHVPFLGSLWASLASAGLVVFGLALRHLWIPGAPSIHGIALTLIFSLFPYHNNLLLFQINAPFIAVFMLLGGLGIVFCDRGGWRTVASVLAMAFALSYQAFFSFFVIAVAILFAITVVRLAFVDKLPVTAWSERLKPVGMRLGCVFAAVALSILIGKAALLLMGGGEAASRTTFASLQDAPTKLQILFGHLIRFPFRRETNIPHGVKGIQLLLLLTAFLGFVRTTQRSRSPQRRTILSLILLIAILAFCATITIFPMLMLSHTNLDPRALGGISVFWAGVFALALTSTGPKNRLLALALGWLLVASYAFITNSISVDFTLLNQRDLLAANRMVERLSQLPGYPGLRTVVVTGSRPGFNMEKLTSIDYFSSSLTIPWSATAVLSSVSEAGFPLPSATDERLAKERAAGKPAWPAPGSVFIDGDVGIVVLGESAGPSTLTQPIDGQPHK